MIFGGVKTKRKGSSLVRRILLMYEINRNQINSLRLRMMTPDFTSV